MKKYLSIMMLAVMGLFILASCSKSDDDPTEPTPTVTECGICYGFKCNENLKNFIKSVEVTYTMPGESEKTETLSFAKDGDDYVVLLEKYTTKKGAFSVKFTVTPVDEIKADDKFDLALGEIKAYGSKEKNTSIKAGVTLLYGKGIKPENAEKTVKNFTNCELYVIII